MLCVVPHHIDSRLGHTTHYDTNKCGASRCLASGLAFLEPSNHVRKPKMATLRGPRPTDMVLSPPHSLAPAEFSHWEMPAELPSQPIDGEK